MLFAIRGNFRAKLMGRTACGNSAIQSVVVSSRTARLCGARCEEYLVTLVVDLRGDRTGFPPEVARELTALRSYFTELHSRIPSARESVAQDD